MKKIILCLSSLIFLTSLSAKVIDDFELIEINEDSYTINFSMEDIQFEALDGYTKVKAGSNGSTGTIGMPELPLFTSMIQIDKGVEYTINYEVKSSYIVEDIKIFPNQNLVNGLEMKEVQDINQDFYNTDHLHPINKIFLSEPMVMRDIDISILSLVPFNYNPKSRELEVYSSIEITLTKNISENQIERSSAPKSKVFEKIYENHILNYSSNNREEDYQTSSILYICGDRKSVV